MDALISFGMFLLALFTLVIVLIKNSIKTHLIFGDNGYFSIAYSLCHCRNGFARSRSQLFYWRN
ncbi:putative holin-like toxin [Leuconostoc citreum]|uniref:putative holin-like toxin n=1 Tax=Leuconostoc citreum TaxID=33964 RepID=UPI003B8A626B